MKIIDLLNKIANGEEIPKRIIFYGNEWEYTGSQYMKVDRENGSNFWTGYNFNILNEEVEIIEEDKKIENLTNHYSTFDLVDKINEIIDKLNKGSE